jgi:murein DD-endopeptidase MepM/ murein hydrolase activator NlpD
MSNQPYSDNRLTRFLTGKGFYVALAICLAGAGVAAWLAVERTAQPDELPEEPQAQQAPAEEWGFPQLEEAARNQTDVEVESSSEPSSSLPEPSSSQPEPPAYAVVSPQSDVPVQQPTLSFVYPLKGDVIQDFSNGELVKNATLNDWRTHNGVDLSADLGTPVAAVADGMVQDVRNDILWGTVVEILHDNGLVSVYCGLDGGEMTAEKGGHVAAGEVIGAVSYIPAEGLEDTHLHLEFKMDSKWIDPMSILQTVPVGD